MRVLSVVGARPQFVKAAVLSAEFARRGVEEILVHTGQHYDASMSDVFFRELDLPKPKYELGVGSAGHGAQTGEMMRRLEPVVLAEGPDWLVVYGDTNSTLAGALVGAKLSVPVAHVEAGLRSFNRGMPEEINRIVADHVASALLVPNARAAAQLEAEGVVEGVYEVGDLMVDLVARVAETLPAHPEILERFGVTPRAYAVATIHRAANTDDITTFRRLIAGLHAVDMTVIFPVHPRTRGIAAGNGVGENDNIIIVPPLGYREMIALMSRASAVFTDSGGMQKEAYVLKVPCVTLRDETEWLETLEDGWNVLAGSDPQRIARSARRLMPVKQKAHYGDGHAAARIAEALACNPKRPHSLDAALAANLKLPQRAIR
ncbi:MAG: UDP-N-acetylglucosamine 2-epimerase (non-hydrolyzing) [Candidatus Eremiobacteraeota bacterium]|nr:UDP-N-acetylglucosamine 2-epimerase (non-hydrolyzing) [Candidatus Eremiobacteraeota bacterium]